MGRWCTNKWLKIKLFTLNSLYFLKNTKIKATFFRFYAEIFMHQSQLS